MSITPLKVVGNQFIDQSGNVIQLRGTNNIGTHYSCLTNQYPYDPVFGGVPYDLASLRIMHDTWGMNCVRVTVNAGCWFNCCVSPYTFNSVYRNAILAYVDNINLAGMYAIINLVNTASGGGAMADISAINFWNSITPMLTNRPLVILEAYNEPNTILLWATWLNGGVNPEGLSYTVYGMQQLVNTIRAAGSTHIILLDGLSYAGDFSGFLAHVPTDTINQLGASWHRYTDWPHTDATSPGSVHFNGVASVAAVYPTTLTEFGGSSDASATVTFNQAYYMSLINFCDSLGIGYLNWAWLQGPGINILSDYTTYQPSAYGTAYYWHLRQKAWGGVPRNNQETRQTIIPTLPW